MTSPRVLVLRAPGINCERETHHAFELAGARCDYVHVRRLLEHPDELDDYAILAVPGGFSYGDDIAAGVVLAHEMRQRLGDRLQAFVDRGGLALGICNGFQVLVRLGLLPRLGGGVLRPQVTLTNNLSNHYECRWVTLGSLPNRCVFVEEGLRLRWPAAHAEGHLVADDETARALEDGYRAFVYLDETDQPTTRYPANPNGTPGGLAGLTDVTGRVLGVMPHPDRAYLPYQMPGWTKTGLANRATVWSCSPPWSASRAPSDDPGPAERGRRPTLELSRMHDRMQHAVAARTFYGRFPAVDPHQAMKHGHHAIRTGTRTGHASAGRGCMTP